MNQGIIDLYHDFTHGEFSRRVFMDRLTRMAGSAAAATAMLPLLQCDYSRAETIAANDPRLATETLTYDWPKGKATGYLARPKAMGKRPVVLVIHQNRGLNPHIKDVARRYAAEGYLAFAPDLLSVAGGTPDTDDKARDAHSAANRTDMFAAALAAAAFIKKHGESAGKLGVVGFCYGGGVVQRLALDSPDIDAAVSYYGGAPADKSKVVGLKAPLLLHYAGLDTNLNNGIPAWEEALKAAGKKYTIHMYPNVNHAFSDDTTGARYDKAAADLAWTRTQAFFREHLGAPPNAA